jgi:hypothetical protein
MDKIEKNKLIIKYINRITKFTLKAEQEAKKVKAKARNKTRHEYILGSLAPNSTIEALDYSRSNSFLTKAVKNELRETRRIKHLVRLLRFLLCVSFYLEKRI